MADVIVFPHSSPVTISAARAPSGGVARLELRPARLAVWIGLSMMALAAVRGGIPAGVSPMLLLAAAGLCWLVSGHARRTEGKLWLAWQVLSGLMAVSSFLAAEQRSWLAALMVPVGVLVWRNAWRPMRVRLLAAWVLLSIGSVLPWRIVGEAAVAGGLLVLNSGLLDYLAALGGVEVVVPRGQSLRGRKWMQ